MTKTNVMKKLKCPQCKREQFTWTKKCYCTFCGHMWEIDWKMTPAEFWSFNSSPKAVKTITTLANTIGVDARALHILFNTQWDLDEDGGSWIEFSEPPAADLKAAKAAGLMHDPLDLDHTKLVSRVIQLRDRIDRQAVVKAFILSLRSHRLDWRSTLGSYGRFLHLPKHTFKADVTIEDGEKTTHDDCGICGATKKIDINVNHNFWRRLMWAGNVCQGTLEYAFSDLSTFQNPKLDVEEEDVEVLKNILAAIRKLPKKAGLGELEKCLTGLFPNNKSERQVLLEILGLCGVLKPKTCPSSHKTWIDERNMPDPTHFFRKEWRSPVNCWTGADGVNQAAVDFWFGDFL